MFVLQLALIGLCVATVPLSYVWMKGDNAKYRKLIWVTTFLALDLIVFGGFTRLTDSGLGCPDWPGCYGTASPLVARAAIHAAWQAMPSGPVSPTKAWIEMVHRYLAMALGTLIVVQTAIAWLRRRQLRVSPWWPTALLLLVCLQGAFGAWTVTQKLQPIIVTTHLLLGLTLLAALGWFAASQTPAPAPIDPTAARWRGAALIGLALLSVQIALGGWVSTNYAVLACTDFPTCNGQWLPAMDFAQGFHLWRGLGRDAAGAMISQAALVAIHWTHRTFAFVVFFYLGWLALVLRRYAALRAPALALAGVLILQVATGLANILLQWPLLIAVAHNAGAAILLLVLVMLNFRIFSRRAAPAEPVVPPRGAAAAM